jgi:hypothetical protein
LSPETERAPLALTDSNEAEVRSVNPSSGVSAATSAGTLVFGPVR